MTLDLGGVSASPTLGTALTYKKVTRLYKDVQDPQITASLSIPQYLPAAAPSAHRQPTRLNERCAHLPTRPPLRPGSGQPCSGGHRRAQDSTPGPLLGQLEISPLPCSTPTPVLLSSWVPATNPTVQTDLSQGTVSKSRRAPLSVSTTKPLHVTGTLPQALL